jgi:hypothetical protein
MIKSQAKRRGNNIQLLSQLSDLLGTCFATSASYVVTTATDSAKTRGGQSSPYLDLRYVLSQILPPIYLFSSDTITIGNSSDTATSDKDHVIGGL